MTEEVQKRTRASGDVLEYLIHEFELNPNPGPDQRKVCSERTGMSEKAIRIWFQNRRAKFKKLERQAKSAKPNSDIHGTKALPHNAYSSPNNNSVDSPRSNLLTKNTKATSSIQVTPSEINEKYCFVDCTSLSVGTWQRVKTGIHDNQALLNSLVNLSPYTLNRCMNNVDLMVIFSKKNAEINYFFLAMANNSKILFRIFYPLASIATCSLLDSSIEQDSIELRLGLVSKPKFSVFFFNRSHANLNQWSICDDFSENQQVSSAFYTPGGTLTPHVLVGKTESLHHLQNYINISKDYPFNASMMGDVVDTSEPLLHENVLGPKNLIEKGDFLHSESDINDTQAFNPENNETWNNAVNDGPDLGLSDMSHLVEPLRAGDLLHHSHHLPDHAGRFEGHKGASNFGSEVFADSPHFYHSVEITDSELHVTRPDHKESVREKEEEEEEEAEEEAEEDHKHIHDETTIQDAHKALRDLHGGPETNTYGYQVEVDPSGFGSDDLVIDSPSLATHSPIPEESISGPAENFLDYESHA